MIATDEPISAAAVASRPAAEKPTSAPPAARLTNVTLRYKKTVALDAVNLEIPAGRMVGLIGPDGVGKSSVLALIAGSRRIQEGRVEVLGGDMADAELSPCDLSAHRLHAARSRARTFTRRCRSSRIRTTSAGCSATARPRASAALLSY